MGSLRARWGPTRREQGSGLSRFAGLKPSPLSWPRCTSCSGAVSVQRQGHLLLNYPMTCLLATLCSGGAVSSQRVFPTGTEADVLAVAGGPILLSPQLPGHGFLCPALSIISSSVVQACRGQQMRDAWLSPFSECKPYKSILFSDDKTTVGP